MVHPEEQQEAELGLLSEESRSSHDTDIEANRKYEQSQAPAPEPEYETPATLKFVWIGAYFGFSMGLTIYNKFILGSVCFARCC